VSPSVVGAEAGPAAQPEFALQIDQNPYLPEGGATMDAAISVTCTTSDGPAPTAAQVIMLDCSTSMYGSKLAAAKRATAVAIDAIRDGVAFALVAGTSNARMAYPSVERMAVASPRTRAEATAAVRALHADGGTAIGTWLALADRLLAPRTEQIKYAILLTDGRNEGEDAAHFDRVLGEIQGRFVCDSRGVGERWEAAPLQAIARSTLGTADGLTEPDRLPAEFRAMTEAVMGKSTADVRLRVWTPTSVRLRLVKQVYPEVIDLAGHALPVGPREVDYRTAAWGAETRVYHLAAELPVGAVGDELLVARVGVAVGDTVLRPSPVLARWTDDLVLSTQINRQVAHYTGQAEMADGVQEGLAALRAGDGLTATAKLGRAVQLAAASGNEEVVKRLSRIVRVVNAPEGTVELRSGVAEVDAEMAAVRSTKTVRVRKGEEH
jgi:von Willebrand factor type A domain/von Willebrand factor type A C-terminal domain